MHHTAQSSENIAMIESLQKSGLLDDLPSEDLELCNQYKLDLSLPKDHRRLSDTQARRLSDILSRRISMTFGKSLANDLNVSTNQNEIRSYGNDFVGSRRNSMIFESPHGSLNFNMDMTGNDALGFDGLFNNNTTLDHLRRRSSMTSLGSLFPYDFREHMNSFPRNPSLPSVHDNNAFSHVGGNDNLGTSMKLNEQEKKLQTLLTTARYGISTNDVNIPYTSGNELGIIRGSNQVGTIEGQSSHENEIIAIEKQRHLRKMSLLATMDAIKNKTIINSGVANSLPQRINSLDLIGASPFMPRDSIGHLFSELIPSGSNNVKPDNVDQIARLSSIGNNSGANRSLSILGDTAAAVFDRSFQSNISNNAARKSSLALLSDTAMATSEAGSRNKPTNSSMFRTESISMPITDNSSSLEDLQSNCQAPVAVTDSRCTKRKVSLVPFDTSNKDKILVDENKHNIGSHKADGSKPGIDHNLGCLQTHLQSILNLRARANLSCTLADSANASSPINMAFRNSYHSADLVQKAMLEVKSNFIPLNNDTRANNTGTLMNENNIAFRNKFQSKPIENSIHTNLGKSEKYLYVKKGKGKLKKKKKNLKKKQNTTSIESKEKQSEVKRKNIKSELFSSQEQGKLPGGENVSALSFNPLKDNIAFYQSPPPINSSKLQIFHRVMKESQLSQSSIQSWDKKMGLKRSHSSTMTRTSQSRKQLRQLFGARDFLSADKIQKRDDNHIASRETIQSNENGISNSLGFDLINGKEMSVSNIGSDNTAEQCALPMKKRTKKNDKHDGINIENLTEKCIDPSNSKSKNGYINELSGIVIHEKKSD